MTTELHDRREDIYDAGKGNVAAIVGTLLGNAWDLLTEAEDSGEGGPVERAGEQVDAAISVLTAYRKRLTRLDEEMEAAALTAAGYTKVESASGYTGWAAPTPKSA